MKTDRTDRELLLGFVALCAAIMGLALAVGVAVRLFRIAAGV